MSTNDATNGGFREERCETFPMLPTQTKMIQTSRLFFREFPPDFERTAPAERCIPSKGVDEPDSIGFPDRSRKVLARVCDVRGRALSCFLPLQNPFFFPRTRSRQYHDRTVDNRSPLKGAIPGPICVLVAFEVWHTAECGQSLHVVDSGYREHKDGAIAARQHSVRQSVMQPEAVERGT